MSYKILIADDEPSIRELVRMALEEANLTEIIEAENGRDTIEKAARFQPSLILLDWMMPEMDGLSVCRTLKMQENTRNIPIIMLTAKSEESDIVLGLEMGAVDYTPGWMSIPVAECAYSVIMRGMKGIFAS